MCIRDSGTAMDLEEALEVAERITYPVVVRPSYCLLYTSRCV